MIINIIISQRIDEWVSYLEKRDSLDLSWHNTLEKLFGAKINLFPIPNKSKNIRDWLNELKIDFFVLTGGNDIGVELERDFVEKEMLDYSKNHNIPLLAICRGMQYVQMYEGGKLVKSIEHINCLHEVTYIQTNKKDTNFLVNSFHSFSIKEINKLKFNAIAYSYDGYIEAMIHNTYPWLAIMWHPEREFANNSFSLNFLKHNLSKLIKK